VRSRCGMPSCERPGRPQKADPQAGSVSNRRSPALPSFIGRISEAPCLRRRVRHKGLLTVHLLRVCAGVAALSLNDGNKPTSACRELSQPGWSLSETSNKYPRSRLRSRNALRRRHSGAKPGRQTPPNRCRQRTSAYLTISNLEQHFRQARPTSVIGSLLCMVGFEFGCRVRTGTAMAK
jgi:hypothetical protein